MTKPKFTPMKHYSLAFTLLLIVTSCAKKRYEQLPLDKPHWEIHDYEEVVNSIRFETPEGEKYLNLQDDGPAFNRLIDKENISAILDDDKLGLSYRNEFAEKMFNVYRDLDETYSGLDRQDKYIYPLELVKIKDWGYFIQLKYFKLGNEQIIKNVVDAESSNVKNVILQNEQTIISNFDSGIEFLTKEDALPEEAINEFSSTIDRYYPQLLETFPNGNYTEMLKKINAILKKVKSENLKKSLSNIKVLIEKQEKSKESLNTDL